MQVEPIIIIIGPRQAKTCLRHCAKCADSPQPANAQSHPDICSPLEHFTVSNDSICGHPRPWSDLVLRCPHIHEDTFTHSAPTCAKAISSRRRSIFLNIYSENIRRGISSESSTWQTIRMKCQIFFFSLRNKKTTTEK